MKIALLTAHSIAEYDDLRMFADMGHDVLSIGAYLDPANPSDDKRPALPDVPPAPAELRALVADQMAAKSDLPDEVLEWADVLIAHHFVDQGFDGRPGWIAGPNFLKAKAHGVRVIWRTCGQSNPMTEAVMGAFRSQGLEIVRYSPKERNLPNYAGEDALIRFGKYPGDYGPWIGNVPYVANVTQHMKQRGDACGYWFWKQATKGLRAHPAGPGSEAIGGIGPLSYDEMRAYLQEARVYLYTGTQPASYTLGLIEAMMTGIPVVSIGPRAFGPGWVGEVFEGHEITRVDMQSDDPAQARSRLQSFLTDPYPNIETDNGYNFWKRRALDLFDIAHVAPQWAAFLR